MVVTNTPEQHEVNLSVLFEQLKVSLEDCAIPSLDFIHVSLILNSLGFYVVARICTDMQRTPMG